jgi:hypothetical protein
MGLFVFGTSALRMLLRIRSVSAAMSAMSGRLRDSHSDYSDYSTDRSPPAVSD